MPTEADRRRIEEWRRKSGPPVGRPFDVRDVDPERVAHALRKAELDEAHAAETLADQSVYLYNGGIMTGHFPPSTRWTLIEEPEGMACQVLLWAPGQGQYVHGPYYAPGEWTFCGRGHPGQ